MQSSLNRYFTNPNLGSKSLNLYIYYLYLLIAVIHRLKGYNNVFSPDILMFVAEYTVL